MGEAVGRCMHTYIDVPRLLAQAISKDLLKCMTGSLLDFSRLQMVHIDMDTICFPLALFRQQRVPTKLGYLPQAAL